MTPEPIGAVLLRDERGEREIAVTDRRHTYDITLNASPEPSGVRTVPSWTVMTR